MNSLPHLSDIFNQLTRGTHLSPEDEPFFSALAADFPAYAEYFKPLGFELIRHEREFFYFAPTDPSRVVDTLPRIAVFSYILVDYAANQGQAIEEYILGRNFLLSALPHFSLDRYAGLLRQVDVFESGDLKRILDHLDRIGWIKWLGPDEFRFLRPFHRVLDKCLDLSRLAVASPVPAENTFPQV
jgi:hypothetical protein